MFKRNNLYFHKTYSFFLYAISLYLSPMVDKDSEYPDATSARAYREKEEQEFQRLFNSQQF